MRPLAFLLRRLVSSAARMEAPFVVPAPRDDRIRLLYRAGREPYSLHRPIVRTGNQSAPVVSHETFVAPCSTLAGSIRVSDRVSIWYGAVLRCEVSSPSSSSSSSSSSQNSSTSSSTHSTTNSTTSSSSSSSNPFGGMEIGYGSNVQDGAVLIGAVKIGQFVTIGHGAQLHACVVGDECLIGMNAVLMPGAVVESGAMVAAGAVVPSGTVVKHGEIWGGKPARKLRDMKDEETEYLGKSAEEYWKLAIEHKNEFEEAAPVFRDVMAIREQLGIKNFD